MALALTEYLYDIGISFSEIPGDRLNLDVIFLDSLLLLSTRYGCRIHIKTSSIFCITLQFEYLADKVEFLSQQYQDQVCEFEQRWLPVIHAAFAEIIEQYGLKLDLEYQAEVDVDNIRLLQRQRVAAAG